MIKSFKNKATLDVAQGKNSSQARRLLPVGLLDIARVRLAALNRMFSLSDLKVIPGYRLEKLSGDRKDQYSIRINIQYRICFDWDGKDTYNVEIVDYH